MLMVFLFGVFFLLLLLLIRKGGGSERKKKGLKSRASEQCVLALGARSLVTAERAQKLDTMAG